jgi:hypothetical protein
VSRPRISGGSKNSVRSMRWTSVSAIAVVVMVDEPSGTQDATRRDLTRPGRTWCRVPRCRSRGRQARWFRGTLPGLQYETG